MGLGNAVKEILNMGGSSSDADRQDGAGATGHSSQQTTTTTTSHSSSSKAGQVDDTCASCDDKWAKEGKAVVWEDAQGKMGQAHEQARIAEKNACMATKALESISELQHVSETSRTRLHELERELTTMRSNGVDLRAKQAEVDAAKRRAEEAHEALIAAEKRAKEHEGVIAEKDQQARAAQGKLQEDEGKVGPLEEELNNVRRARTEVEERYNKEQTEWRELEGIYNSKESEFKHLQDEETTHKRAVEEAEAALAAAKERYQHFHGNFQNFKNKHTSLVTRRDELHSQTTSTKKYLEEVREHEMDLQRRLEELKGLQHQHHGAARTAADAAQAERQRHQEHVSTLQGIEQRITTHTTSAQKAEENLSQAEQQARAERERQAALSRELEETKSTTTTTSTNAAEKLEEYEVLKARAREANARKEELFDEAKRLGAIGDRNADAHLRDMEARMKNVDVSSIKSKSGTTTTTTTTRRTLTNEE